jgi:hypothetical protein
MKRKAENNVLEESQSQHYRPNKFKVMPADDIKQNYRTEYSGEKEDTFKEFSIISDMPTSFYTKRDPSKISANKTLAQKKIN